MNVPPPGNSKARRGRRFVVHAARVGLFCAIVALIHLEHRERDRARRAEAVAFEAPLDEVRQLMPGAAGLDGVDPDTRTRDVLDADGKRIGYILQTAPDGDDAIGFSGPTNVLLGFDTDDRVLGAVVLSSGDTDEHVRRVENDERFLDEYVGRTWSEALVGEGVDAVSGATLTSLAIKEAITTRLLVGPPTPVELPTPPASLKFPDPPTVEAARTVFERAARLEPDDDRPGLLQVLAEDGTPLGAIVRSVPAAEDVIGYQGPTETLIALDTDERVVGFVVGRSFDNEPYVGYVRDEPWYLSVFDGRPLAEVAGFDVEAAGVEGVSGATMTSMAVARGIPEAAAAHLKARPVPVEPVDLERPESSWSPTVRDVGTTVVVLLGLVVGLTSLRGQRWVRIPFQLLLVAYLGFVNGDLVSQALLVGWARHGVPVASTAGLAVLTFAALVVPVVSKSNVYCTHLCPHGAIQQLVRDRLPWRVHLSRSWSRFLSVVPALLLVWVVVVGMGAVTASLVDVEPFDAYVPTIAGRAAITIFAVGLVASLFVPMAYCRYGCPTGALLGFLRFNARSDRLGARDAVAAACFVTALALSAG